MCVVNSFFGGFHSQRTYFNTGCQETLTVSLMHCVLGCGYFKDRCYSWGSHATKCQFFYLEQLFPVKLMTWHMDLKNQTCTINYKGISSD